MVVVSIFRLSFIFTLFFFSMALSVLTPCSGEMGATRERLRDPRERVGSPGICQRGEEVSHKRDMGRNRVLVIRCLVGAGGAKHE
jgi:hypothetical protein